MRPKPAASCHESMKLLAISLRICRRPSCDTQRSLPQYILRCHTTSSRLHLPHKHARTGVTMSGINFAQWTREQLIARVNDLEHRLEANGLALSPNAASSPPPKPKKPPRSFDPSKYSTRLIALKFAYLGQNYNGFEHHANNDTPLPTIEEELWKAMVKTKLIFPTAGEEGGVNWDGCEYSKCGRTDRGVSAFGQVVGIRVRSNRPLPMNASEGEANGEPSPLDNAPYAVIAGEEKSGQTTQDDIPAEDGDILQEEDQKPPFDPVGDELPYVQILNRVLPPDIRILAWCSEPPPNFSARFSCRERRYKYFFTQPAFSPTPGSPEAWLDIEKMKEAAQYYVGLHDFRNFCKIDPSKQITNFERRIFKAEIEEVAALDTPTFFRGGDFDDAAKPKLYAFVVHGSAFLWHQVRHLVAVLFLVGQGFEQPTVVRDLLDISKVPAKPRYDMADDAPLVLWDCVFPADGSGNREDALGWIYHGQRSDSQVSHQDYKYGHRSVVEDVWTLWRKRKIDEVLTASLLDVVATQGRADLGMLLQESPRKATRNPRVFDGGNKGRTFAPHVPLIERPRNDTAEVTNARYLERKGIKLSEAAVSKSGDDANE